MNAYEKIRAALDCIHGEDSGKYHAALAALAELERAAAEPVAWIICKPTHGHDIGRYLAWNAGHVPYSVGTAAEPLYTTPPPAPVAEMREPRKLSEVTQEMCERVAASFYGAATFANGVEMNEALQLWRAELGPTLGIMEMREPTPEECERIYADWLHAETHGSTAGQRMGRAMFDAVRAVMGGEK